MRKTNKELAEFYRIKEGDIVIIYDDSDDSIVYGQFECKDLEAMHPLKVITCSDHCLHDMEIGCIRSRKYKIRKPKKTYGETCCNDYLYCKKCPLGILKCNSSRTNSKSSLYETLNDICSNYSIKSDNPIYLAFKAELDKEVK